MARVVKLEEGMRFECSNYELEDANTTTNPLKNGALVHYDHDSKKFKISNKTAVGYISSCVSPTASPPTA